MLSAARTELECPCHPPLRCRLSPAGDSWGIFTFLCAALCNLPALPALNCSEELGAGQSIQQTYDLTRYLEHQLRTLAGTYVSPHPPPRDIHPVPSCSHAGGRGNASSPPGRRAAPGHPPLGP